MHLLLLLLFHRIGLNDCWLIDPTDIIHTPSTKALNVRLVNYVIFIEIPRHLLKDLLLFVSYLKSYFILSCVPFHPYVYHGWKLDIAFTFKAGK
jgi:hypothetical protein